MRRVWTLVAVATVALCAQVGDARAATTNTPGGGEVRALSVVPAMGRAEVVVAVDGAVEVKDFTLSGPPRVVLDLHGAKLGAPSRFYDRKSRGGIVNVRMAQFRENIVRVVIDMDAPYDYTLVRGADGIRVTINAERGAFTAWHNTPDRAAPPPPAYSAAARGEVAPARTVMSSRATSAAPRTVRAAAQPRITVTYQDADIRDVIAAFAAFSGRTIVVGKGVQGTVTAEVRDQPWDIALRAILSSQGLAAQEDQSGIISVDSYANILSQQAQEPLATQVISVNYARAASLVSTISSLLSKDCGSREGGGAAGACITRGSVSADSGTNRLLVTDVPSRLPDIAQYVKDLDVRTPQVAIKAKIIFVNRTNIEDLGVTYDLGSQTQFFNRLVQRADPTTFQPIDTDGDGIPDAVGGGETFDKNINVIDLGGNALAALANANQRVALPALELIFSTAIGKFDLTAFIDALQEVQLADIQAEPSIVTLDNRKAEILVGEETPIRVIDYATGSTGNTPPRATVSFKETGIILSVTPHITNNRQILMSLHSERSNLTTAASDLGYTFQKQRADNELLVADGETAVIGGLTVTQVTVSKAGIPLLVDLPIIGRLFGQTRTREEKRDLLILVTPHIIDEGDRVVPPGGSN